MGMAPEKPPTKPKIYLKRIVNSYMAKAAENSDPATLATKLAIIQDEVSGFSGDRDDFIDLSSRVNTLASEIAVSATRKKEAGELLERVATVQESVVDLEAKVSAKVAATAKKEVSNDVKVGVAALARSFKKAGVGTEVFYDMDGDVPVAKIVLGTVRQPSPELVFKDTTTVNFIVGDYSAHVRLASEDPFPEIRKALLMRGYRV